MLPSVRFSRAASVVRRAHAGGDSVKAQRRPPGVRGEMPGIGRPFRRPGVVEAAARACGTTAARPRVVTRAAGGRCVAWRERRCRGRSHSTPGARVVRSRQPRGMAAARGRSARARRSRPRPPPAWRAITARPAYARSIPPGRGAAGPTDGSSPRQKSCGTLHAATRRILPRNKTDAWVGAPGGCTW
jgi:hypothetical protein